MSHVLMQLRRKPGRPSPSGAGCVLTPSCALLFLHKPPAATADGHLTLPAKDSSSARSPSVEVDTNSENTSSSEGAKGTLLIHSPVELKSG
ncbi:unnamed protein product [Rangifer tarandus platyrhynchus]|uniref:Uncharacterized protein n=1 Tax=Rangifer tarandus platyrhynchus TaxID=3082113 RepID=A0AC59YL50_RANTA